MRHISNLTLAIFIPALLFGSGCGDDKRIPTSVDKPEGANMTITITSTAFNNGEAIPKKYTGEGQDVSPPLQWSGVPKDAKELALICDDPDAPRAEPWVHWVIYSIQPNTSGLPEAIPAQDKINEPNGAQQGTNDFKKIGYNGPMPPKAHGVHHYRFHLYVLNSSLNLSPKETKKTLLDAMKGHVIAEGQLIGTYERK